MKAWVLSTECSANSWQLDNPSRGRSQLRAVGGRCYSPGPTMSHSQIARPTNLSAGQIWSCVTRVVRQDNLLEQCVNPKESTQVPRVKFSTAHWSTIKTFNDPSAGSPTETLLRLLLPLNASVWSSSRSPVSVSQEGHNPRTSLPPSSQTQHKQEARSTLHLTPSPRLQWTGQRVQRFFLTLFSKFDDLQQP